ncbi:hypothetical protein KAI65_02160 [Candidatus Parcubacteria bacterium]|nr:hypothetical protein [Candidatus Parcubacteria bacterium]
MDHRFIINNKEKRLRIACGQLERAISRSKNEPRKEELENQLEKIQKNLKSYMEERL